MKFFVKFLCITAWLFTSGIIIDYFVEYPMSMEANLIIAVVISLIVVVFTAYNEKKEKNKEPCGQENVKKI